MCLLALFFRVVDDAPVVVGANREEFYARGGEPPHILEGPVPAVAGTDPQAGGTWLGVNARGVLVAVTNRPRSDPPARPRSRGLLVRNLLTSCTSARAAAEVGTRELDGDRYAGCNLLCVDRDTAVVFEAADWLRVRPLPPGLHVLTNQDVNDASDPRVGHSLWWLGGRDYSTARDCVAALKELCAQTGDGGPPICFRKKDRGTVSSTIVALRQPPGQGTYLHAQGPPDHTPYSDCSHLLRELRTEHRVPSSEG
jgi:uncharacterized protein with NRDE domain